MDISRRDFLKISGGTAVAAGVIGLTPDEIAARELELRTKGAVETTTICPNCSVGCGIIVHTKDGKVINTEGDPEHPINEGTLCSKGQSLYQVVTNPKRLTKPLYRASGASEWGLARGIHGQPPGEDELLVDIESRRMRIHFFEHQDSFRPRVTSLARHRGKRDSGTRATL